MRLADYVVSYSLQANNRCLRYLAECDAHGSMVEEAEMVSAERHTVLADSLLARDCRRLMSMWSLMQPAWESLGGELDAHLEALKYTSMALHETASLRRLALRMAHLAVEDSDAQAMMMVARGLPFESPLTWDDLNGQFTMDSQFWRHSRRFLEVDDTVIERRILRSYRKSFRRSSPGPQDDVSAWLDRGARNLNRWVQLAAHQLELLRPGLSERGKAQLWYLEKLADTLRTRKGLRALLQALPTVNVDEPLVRQAAQHTRRQLDKMDKRIAKLGQGCFTSKPKRMAVTISSAVAALGLSEVSVIPTSVPADGTSQPENDYG